MTTDASFSSDLNLDVNGFEQERMDDVQLLLDNLFRREEATVLMVLDCLYEVGTHHFVSQKVRARMGRKALQSAARPIKPVFKAIALRWFKCNAPQLLADWLYDQVRFESDASEPEQADTTVATTLLLDDGLQLELAQLNNQAVKRLEHQVRVLSCVAVGAIATLIGTLVS